MKIIKIVTRSSGVEGGVMRFVTATRKTTTQQQHTATLFFNRDIPWPSDNVHKVVSDGIQALNFATLATTWMNSHLTDEAFIGMSKRSYMEVVMNGLNSNDSVDVGLIAALAFQFQVMQRYS
ncbi:hypothetical protein C5167_014452 [Papaver somniferum]|uniref:Uncharacterized protein n=1 Tax=Papaver somniferum TaxID=3469 RepID=A0A4Y7J392_PAPSO|nr:hypothetical protein C5167_014452 [Papaver somniferum]